MKDLQRVLASAPLTLEQSFRHTTLDADVDRLSASEAKNMLKHALREMSKKQNIIAALSKEIIAKEFDQIGH